MTTAFRKMKPIAFTLLAALLLAGGTERPAERGAAIYREGRVPSGGPLAATVQGDVPLKAREPACAGCHRRSGMGTSEGGFLVPPLTAEALFEPRRYDRGELPGERHAGSRPAYSEETLLRAIREGIDPSGRRLDRLMPRYRLSDADGKDLIAYLRTLTARSAPGVTADEIHFATVVAPGVSQGEREELIAALEGYFRAKNGGSRGEERRAAHVPWTREGRYDAWRRWRLHIWELEGGPEGWREQLAARYRSQPVFALIGGAGEPWGPIHDFCEAEAIPCLFPWTATPGRDPYWSVYLSAGLELETRAIAKAIAREGVKAPLQVMGEGREAEILRSALGADGGAGGRGGAILVVLGGKVTPEALAAAARQEGLRRVYLSSHWRDRAAQLLPPTLHPHAYIAWPYRLPSGGEGRADRWLRSRGVGGGGESSPLQQGTLLAAAVTGEALMQMQTFFSRDYLLERVEHAANRGTFPSPFPRFGLGPMQRFGAKGCYLLNLGDAPRFREAEWIAP